MEMADFQLAALAAAGYAVVPVEPTKEMLEAEMRTWVDGGTEIENIVASWHAMLAAAKP